MSKDRFQCSIDLVLLSRVVLRTWLDEPLLQELSRVFRLRILVAEELLPGLTGYQLSTLSKYDYATVLIPDLRWSRRHWQLSWIGNLEHGSYRQIFIREYLGNYRILPRTNLVRHKISCTVRAILKLLKSVTHPGFYLAITPPIARLMQKIARRRLEKELMKRAIEAIIPEKFGEYVLLPSLGLDPKHDTLLSLAKANGATTVLITENWDNLTSKSSFAEKPDYLTSMGTNNLELISRLHDIPLQNIWPIGLAKYEHLPNVRQSRADAIWYLGYSQPHDELNSLGIIFDASRESKIYGTNLRLCYRPHPHRVKPAYTKFDRIMDFTEFVHDTSEVSLNGGLPSLNFTYRQSLQDAFLVIGPPTTMLLEAAAAGFPVIADCIDDQIHRSSAGVVYKDYSHMQDLEKVRNIKIARSEEQLGDFVRQAVNDMDVKIPDVNDVLTLSPGTFASRLRDRILSVNLNASS